MSVPWTGSDIISGIGGAAGLIGGAIQGRKNRKMARELNAQNIAMQKETNAQQYKMWQEQIQQQWDMFHATNEYNSPEHQRELYDAAGINYMNIASGDSQSTMPTVPGAPSMTAPQYDIGSEMSAANAAQIGPKISSAIQDMSGILSVFDKADEIVYNASARDKDLYGKDASNRGQDLHNQLQEDLNPLEIQQKQEAIENLKLSNAEKRINNSMLGIKLQYLPAQEQATTRQLLITTDTMAQTQLDDITKSHLSVEELKQGIKHIKANIAESYAKLPIFKDQHENLVVNNRILKNNEHNIIEQQANDTMASIWRQQMMNNQLRPQGMSFAVYNGLGGWQGIQQKCGQWFQAQREFDSIQDKKSRTHAIGNYLHDKCHWTRDQVKDWMNMDIMVRNEMLDNFWHVPNEIGAIGSTAKQVVGAGVGAYVGGPMGAFVGGTLAK